MRSAPRPALGSALRSAAGLLVGALLVTTAGCGEATTEDYCRQLGEDRQAIADIVASDDAGRLLDSLEIFQDLRDQAPRDLRDEWDTFLGALQGLARALRAAGVSPSDFDGGEPPASLSASERADVVAAADRVSDDDVIAAASGIETQARDVCKINLGL